MKLPLNCEVEYLTHFLSGEESEELFHHLLQYEDLTTHYPPETLDGKTYQMTFGKLMFLDQDLYDANKFPEAIWGKTTVWSEQLSVLKKRVEEHTKSSFQVGVCIYYPNGESGVDFHSDFVAFGDTSLIPSLSLGEEREFLLREKETMKQHSLVLEQGSLLVMGENCQERYEHALPINPGYQHPRINLTFRAYGF